MQNIPTRASINSGLKKLEMHLKAAADIVKTTHLNAGYSHAAETASIVIPGVNPLQEGTVRHRKVARNVAHKKAKQGKKRSRRHLQQKLSTSLILSHSPSQQMAKLQQLHNRQPSKVQVHPPLQPPLSHKQILTRHT